MKLSALIIAASAALAPMQAYAGQAQVPTAPFQVANGGGEDSNNNCANASSIFLIVTMSISVSSFSSRDSRLSMTLVPL
jgi:hypothetical protein